MSRIGKKPVKIPAGVDVQVNGQNVKAKGKLGELSLNVHDDVSVKIEDIANDEGQMEKHAVFSPRSSARTTMKIWPTMLVLFKNMLIGVTTGYKKDLELQGVGYRANLQGKTLVLSLGFSHEVRFPIPDGINVKMEGQTAIEITGIDKQKVGQVAAKIRGLKPPEPYKGKGIRYVGEYILRKEGKKK